MIAQNSEMKEGQEGHDDHYGYGILRIDLLVNYSENNSSISVMPRNDNLPTERHPEVVPQTSQAIRRTTANVPPDSSTKETE